MFEPVGTCRSDGKRADGVSYFPWREGKQLIWDATCRDTLANSYILKTSITAGEAALIGSKSPSEKKPPPYPVIVYIHGESFEWNSGNPYDGSVLASHGDVIVVTLNFRLGILGFLKLESSETTRQSNFGLMDQLAALVWIKGNIAAFGGDANSITLMGHGTGAVCASWFTISPLALMNNKRLFHRAILMSGSALSDWAMIHKPVDVSREVASKLNCQLDENFAACLRRKNLDEIMAAVPSEKPYTITFGPVVDNLFVASDPSQSMEQYKHVFDRFELMYGVTELESKNLPLGDVAFTHGMLEKERDEELRKYIYTRCDAKPEACFAKTRARYNFNKHKDSEFSDYTDDPPDRAALLARDELLDILSDARTVAPVIQMGLHHSRRNIQSYFYVFTHKTHHAEYIINKTYTGEELPYVFGVPIDGTSSQYTEQEKMFSQIIMTYFCNFAYTGNPNMPREYFSTGEYRKWKSYDVEWHEFKPEDQLYIELDIPIQTGQFYRREFMEYWNNEFPNITNAVENFYKEAVFGHPTTWSKNDFATPKNPLPWNKFEFAKFENFKKPVQPMTKEDYERIERIAKIKTGGRERLGSESFGTVFYEVTEKPNVFKEHYKESSEEVTGVSPAATSISMLIIVGGLFLIANVVFFTVLYVKCIKKKKSSTEGTINEPKLDDSIDESNNKKDDKLLFTNCNIIKIWSKSKVENAASYEAVNVESKLSPKLTRHMSNSTIDAHAKVRDWITNEIIYKYSPQNLRKTNTKNHKDNKIKSKIVRQTPVDFPVETEKHSTLGKSSTRPVSLNDDIGNVKRPLLIKTASIDSSKRRKLTNRVSVAVDATPAGRGPSVLMQQPIELSKSLDYPRVSPNNLRRSITLEDFSPRKLDNIENELRRSITNIDITSLDDKPKIVAISHKHSKSDPVQDLNYTVVKKLKTFDPNCDINVTSRDELYDALPELTPEEALQNIKRRNYPKVLPDHPRWQENKAKRMSMPVQRGVYPIFENAQYSSSEPYSPTGKSILRFPPIPPPRTSTLPRQPSNSQPVCLSEPMLVEENSPSPEPEITCNNLYVGPLIPKNKNLSQDRPNKNIFEKTDNNFDTNISKTRPKAIPKSIITTNPNNPIKKPDPKFVVRPTLNKQRSEEKIYARNIPRVVVPDNNPESVSTKIPEEVENREVLKDYSDPVPNYRPKKSHIPTLIKSSNPSLNNSSSSSESNTTSPSEGSDTGTVVKKI